MSEPNPATKEQSRGSDDVKQSVDNVGGKDASKKQGKKQKGGQKPQSAQPQMGDNEKPESEVKSKAQLKAERRAIQEAQRAAKLAAKGGAPNQGSGGKAGGGKPKPNEGGASKPGVGKGGKGKKVSESNQVAAATQSATGIQAGGRPRLASESAGGQSLRVAYNVQMDDEKVQKKISKKLAKQQVPQRSVIQKKVNLFSHLHQYEKDLELTKEVNFSSGAIHPLILKLGLQYAEGIISGSNARCIALLCTFKKVISDYTTPPSKELSRDLEAKIKPYISFLAQCRHLSVSMGNAIKYLKQQITQSSPELSENDAKDALVQSLDDYIQERIYLAGEAISKTFAGKKINNGDKIMIYGFSSLIIKVLKDAHADGKQFQVVVVDSRPKFEGRECIRRLSAIGIKCSYILTNAVSYIMKEISTVFLGAHALLANGYVMSRVGTSMVAMVAKSYNVPVLVCCETYKFCERVQTDAFVFNELGNPDTLLEQNHAKEENALAGWRDSKHLYLLNLNYDVTPPTFVDMVITELGMIPCTSVPVILRVKNTET